MKTIVTITTLILLATPAWAQSDLRFRNQLRCPMDSLHYGMVVFNDVQNCYKPARRNDGPVYRGYENPNRIIMQQRGGEKRKRK